MTISSFQSEAAINRATYERVREQIQHATRGHYAAIAHGRLISVAPTFEEAVAAVEKLQPSPEHALGFPVDEAPAFEVIDDFFTAE